MFISKHKPVNVVLTHLRDQTNFAAICVTYMYVSKNTANRLNWKIWSRESIKKRNVNSRPAGSRDIDLTFETSNSLFKWLFKRSNDKLPLWYLDVSVCVEEGVTDKRPLLSPKCCIITLNCDTKRNVQAEYWLSEVAQRGDLILTSECEMFMDIWLRPDLTRPLIRWPHLLDPVS